MICYDFERSSQNRGSMAIQRFLECSIDRQTPRPSNVNIDPFHNNHNRKNRGAAMRNWNLVLFVLVTSPARTES